MKNVGCIFQGCLKVLNIFYSSSKYWDFNHFNLTFKAFCNLCEDIVKNNSLVQKLRGFFLFFLWIFLLIIIVMLGREYYFVLIKWWLGRCRSDALKACCMKCFHLSYFSFKFLTEKSPFSCKLLGLTILAEIFRAGAKRLHGRAYLLFVLCKDRILSAKEHCCR